jgi:hypothetical protein
MVDGHTPEDRTDIDAKLNRVPDEVLAQQLRRQRVEPLIAPAWWREAEANSALWTGRTLEAAE